MNVKKVFLPSFILLLITLTMVFIPTEKESSIYKDTLRLHILADSDSKSDQDTKIAVRDAVLLKYGEALKGTELEAAISGTEAMLPEIEEFVNLTLADMGVDDKATVSLAEEWYDTRIYDDFTLPRGYYTSLKIVIGSGSGKNWWCVMYPPLCLDLATESAPIDDALVDYSKEEIALIKSKKYNVKFKMLEIFSSVLEK